MGLDKIKSILRSEPAPPQATIIAVEKEDTSNYCACSHLLGALFHSRSQTHWWHLQTTSLAAHKTLNEYYDAVVDFADRYAEAYMGCYNMRVTVAPTAPPFCDYHPEKVKMHFDGIMEVLGSVKHKVAEKGDLVNIVDEIAELVHRTNYLLTLS